MPIKKPTNYEFVKVRSPDDLKKLISRSQQIKQLQEHQRIKNLNKESVQRYKESKIKERAKQKEKALARRIFEESELENLGNDKYKQIYQKLNSYSQIQPKQYRKLMNTDLMKGIEKKLEKFQTPIKPVNVSNMPDINEFARLIAQSIPPPQIIQQPVQQPMMYFQQPTPLMGVVPQPPPMMSVVKSQPPRPITKEEEVVEKQKSNQANMIAELMKALELRNIAKAKAEQAQNEQQVVKPTDEEDLEEIFDDEPDNGTLLIDENQPVGTIKDDRLPPPPPRRPGRGKQPDEYIAAQNAHAKLNALLTLPNENKQDIDQAYKEYEEKRQLLEERIKKYMKARERKMARGQMSTIGHTAGALMISPNVKDLKKSLKVLFGEIKAGNKSKEIRNSIVEIIDYLYKHKNISRSEYKQLSKSILK